MGEAYGSWSGRGRDFGHFLGLASGASADLYRNDRGSLYPSPLPCAPAADPTMVGVLELHVGAAKLTAAHRQQNTPIRGGEFIDKRGGESRRCRDLPPAGHGEADNGGLVSAPATFSTSSPGHEANTTLGLDGSCGDVEVYMFDGGV